MYEYPFRLPSNFTYIMRALMTLEGIGVVRIQPASSKRRNRLRRFMLRREGRIFRQLIYDKLTGRENGEGRIAWSRVWKHEDGRADVFGKALGDVFATFVNKKS